MRAEIISWMAAILLMATNGAAQSTASSGTGASPDILDLLSDIPTCGLNCLLELMPMVGCDALDVECQCASTNSTRILQPCLVEKCTYEETFSLLRIQGDLCNKPHDNRSVPVRITAWFSLMVPIIATTMRFTSRYIGGSKFWWDDWLQLIATTLIVPASIMLMINSYSGLGSHIWDLTYKEATRISLYTYIATVPWAVNLLLLKFSILCLYLRIFPNLWLRRAIYGFSVFTICYTIPLIFLAAFQCVPVSAVWDLEKQKTARCIDYIAVLRATVIFEVIIETFLFLLPIPVVMKLQMEKSKKIILIAFFGMGIGVIGVSIARLPTLHGVTDSDDPTYTVVDAGIIAFWASIVGHICAAVPTIRSLQRSVGKTFKRVFFSHVTDSSNSSGFGYGSGQSRSNNPSRQKSGNNLSEAEKVRKGWNGSGTSRSSTSNQLGETHAISSILDDDDKLPNHHANETFDMEAHPGDASNAKPKDSSIPLGELQPRSQRPFSGARGSPRWSLSSKQKDDKIQLVHPAPQHKTWVRGGYDDRVGDADSLSSEKELVKE